MDGLLVAWSEEEIQAIDGENFGEVVVQVVESFFDGVVEPTEVTVNWETATRNHGVEYYVSAPPQLGMETCYVPLESTRDAEYRIELTPDTQAIRQFSNDYVEELTHLEFRAVGVAIDKDSNSIELAEIPEQIRKQAIRAAPDIEW